MTDLSLQERLARLGPPLVADPVSSGSSAAFLLTRAGCLRDVMTISATLDLARRGAALDMAKRTIEDVVDAGQARITLPRVEPGPALVDSLAAHGIAAQRLDIVAVRPLREALGLALDQFAQRFGLDPVAVQDWEQGRSVPDAAARSYLRVIAHDPALVEAALRA